MAENWMPAGDQGIIATRAYDVLSSHTPLVGQYSLVSQVTGHLTYSPGPMLYWLLALPARFGAPGTIALTMGLANALAIVGIVALARRRGGVGLMFVAATAVALMCRSFAPETLHDIWNPSAGLFPFTALIFLCWSLACGEHRLLPLTVLVASFVAQCQVAFLAPTAGLLALGLVGLAVSRGWVSPGSLAAARGSWRGNSAAARPPPTSPAASTGRQPVWPWALAALVVVVICWSAPLIDELAHRPGNLTLLARAATVHKTTMGTTAASHAVIRAVGIAPRWLRLPSDPYDTRVSDVLTAPSALSTGSCVALLLALFLVATLGLRRRRADVCWGALIGLVLCGAFAALAADTPTSSAKTLGYTLWWGSAAGMWVWVILAWSAVELVRRGPRPARTGVPALASVLGIGALAAVGGAVAAAETPDSHSPEYGPISAIAKRLDGALPRGRTVWLRSSLGGVASPLEPAIKFVLRREGLRILQRGASLRLGPWYEIDHRRYDYVVYAYDRYPPHDRRATVLARVTMKERNGSRAVIVSVAAGSAARTGR